MTNWNYDADDIWTHAQAITLHSQTDRYIQAHLLFCFILAYSILSMISLTWRKLLGNEILYFNSIP